MPNFILTADSHLRESQYGIFARGRDFLDSLKRVVDLADKHKATILHAGDLLDSRDLKGPVAGHLLELDAYCQSKKVRMLVVDGNHDHSDPPWAETLTTYRQALGVKTAAFGLFSLDHRSEVADDISVSGLPFMAPQDFREAVNTMPPSDILVWHGMVSDVMGGGANENMVSFRDLPAGKFRVFLVGDVHMRVVQQTNGCLCVSPGSTELCSKSEPFEKSVELLTIEPGTAPVIAQLPLPTRKAMGFRIMNEADIAEVIGKLRSLKDTALVFVSFDPGVVDVDKRLRLAVDETKVILRCDQLDCLVLPPLPGLSTEGEQEPDRIFETSEELVSAILAEEVLSPAEFIPTLLTDPALRKIATTMLGDENPAPALNAWVENKLTEITEHVS